MRLAAGFGEALEHLRDELDAPILATTSAGGIQVSAVVQGRGVVVVEAGPLFRLRQSARQTPLRWRDGRALPAMESAGRTR